MAMNLSYELFDLEREGPKPLWELYSSVYGSDELLRRRWHWEIEEHPLRNRLRIIVARDGERLVGQSVRLPVDIVLENKLLPAEFAVNSMVHPDYRGHGVIRNIYRFGFEAGILQLSKGTAPGMYRLLMKMGYRKIKPDTFMVALLRPFSWVSSKLMKKTVRLPSPGLSGLGHDNSGFTLTDNFESDWILPTPPVLACCQKTASFLNWRYCKIPHQVYNCYVKEQDNKVEAWYVLHFQGSTAVLVDLGWDGSKPGSLDALIRSAKRRARMQGAIKISFWGNNVGLRGKLKKRGFRPRPESPGFSCYSLDKSWLDFPWSESHFVHGDGDVDYL